MNHRILPAQSLSSCYPGEGGGILPEDRAAWIVDRCTRHASRLTRGLRAVALFLLLASAAAWAAAPADAPVITPLGTGDPIYLFPSNVWGRENAASTDIITWGAVNLATQYRVWVVELPPGPYLTASGNENYVTQTNTTWTPNPAFSAEHTYGACVQAGNDDGWGPYSDWMNFVVGPAAAPAAPSWTTPQNYELGTGDLILLPSNVYGRANAQDNPTIQWNAAANATFYRVCVRNYTMGVWLTVSSNGNYVQQTGTTWTAGYALSHSHTYGVCVDAGNDFGLTWSSWMNFVVGPAAAPSVGPTVVPPGTLDSETGYYAGVDARPTIQWSAVDGATVYYMRLYDKTTYSNVLEVQQSGTTWYLDPVTYPALSLSTSHIYSVSVAAGNDFGWTWLVVDNVVVWQDFVVGPANPPGQPTLILPDSVADNVTQPAIAWNLVDGAVVYCVALRDDTLNQLACDYVQLPGLLWTPTEPLVERHFYRVWVIAWNDFGWGEWSDPPRSFHVGDLTPPVISDLVPSYGGSINSRRPQISAQITDSAPANVLAGVPQLVSGVDWTSLSVALFVTSNANPAALAPVTLTYDGNQVPTGFVCWPAADLVEGTYTVTVSVSDIATNSAAVEWWGWWFVVDVTPPVITAADIVVEATSEQGTLVDFTDVTATDNFSTPGLAFSPMSGSLFPVGDPTEVTVTATDGAFNTSTATFNVYVLDMPPIISNLAPDYGSTEYFPRPTISADITAQSCGVNWATLVVTLIAPNEDETVVTPTLVYDGTTCTGFTYTPTSDLGTGLNRVRVSIDDNVPCTTQVEWPYTYAVDSTAPTFSDLTPAPDSYVYFSQPLIAAHISDDESGVNQGRVLVTVDGDTVTPLFNWTGFVYIPDQDMDAERHHVEVTAYDFAGNLASTDWYFTYALDQTAPVISNRSPADSSTVYVRQPEISADITDTESGVKWDLLEVTLDSVQVYPDWEGASFTYTPEAELEPGTYTLTVLAYDYSGNWVYDDDWSFTVSTNRAPEDVPVLTAPTGTGNGTTPEFDWTSVTYATFYDLWVDDLTSSTPNVIWETGLTGTTFTPTTALADNHSFSARVRAGNSYGCTIWSLPVIFATGNAPVAPPLGVPEMTAPTGSGNSTTPTFTWTAVTDAAFYDLSVYDLSSGTANVIRETQIAATSFAPVTPLEDSHAFAFRVRPGNTLGYGGWSDYGFAETGTGDPLLEAWVGGSAAASASSGGDVAYSPRKTAFKTWEPGVWGRGTRATDAVKAKILPPCDQGYDFFPKRNYYKYGFGSCTRANWDTFASGSGIGMWSCHGTPDGDICAMIVYVPHASAEPNLAAQWRNGGVNPELMSWTRVQSQDLPGYDECIVYVSPAWFAANWAPTFSANRAIVIGGSCYSVPAVDACHPRTGFGYSFVTYESAKTQDMTRLFGFMDGTLKEGKTRLAGKAYYERGYSFGFMIVGEPDTTLCPSVDRPPLDMVVPVGLAASSGYVAQGAVRFDTHCETFLEADYILTYSPSPPGCVVIYNIRWDGDYIIRFDYQYLSGRVTMRVNGLLVTALDGGQQLDGGEIDDSGQGPYGVAPNKDDFIWHFHSKPW